MGEGPPGDAGVGGDEGVAVVGVAEGFFADPGDRLGRELAAEALAGEPLAAGVEDGDGAADGGGDGGGDFLQAALLEDQPLEPPLHGDPALQFRARPQGVVVWQVRFSDCAAVFVFSIDSRGRT